MKRTMLLVVTVGLLVAADAPGDDAKAVEQSLRSLNEAYLKKDVDAIKRLTGEDLVAIATSGRRQSREEQLRSLADLTLSKYLTEDVRVTMPKKDVAIVTFTSTVQGSFKGKALPPRSAVATVWAQRDGKWLEVFYQATPLPAK